MQRISSNVIQLYDQYYCPKGVAISAMLTPEQRILVTAYMFEPTVSLHILHKNNSSNTYAVSRISKHLIPFNELLVSKTAYQNTVVRTIFADSTLLFPSREVMRLLLAQAMQHWATDALVVTHTGLPVDAVAALNTQANFYKPFATADAMDVSLSDGWDVTETISMGTAALPPWMQPWVDVLESKRAITFYVNHVPESMFMCHNRTCAGMSYSKFTCYQGHDVCCKCLECYVQAYCLALTECIQRPDLLTEPCASVPPMTCPVQGCVQHINTDILLTINKNKKQVHTIKELQETFKKYFCK